MSNSLPRLEVCLSPALLHLFDTQGAIVVIIDVFRATSTIAAALHNGARAVMPVASVQECIDLGKVVDNSITAGERDGKVAEGLQYGNSPSEYPPSFIRDKTLILTTTNGTRLLHMVENADTIITGSFLNLSAVSDFLAKQTKNVILACAAWKDRFNIEDALFAGAVVQRIAGKFAMNCDSARAARQLYRCAEGGLFEFIKDSAHYHRLSAYGLQQDMEYCMTTDLHNILPILNGKELVVHQADANPVKMG